MTDFSDLLTATKAAVDPSTSAADLAQIAQAQPRLWPEIAAHPNAYPDLLSWLSANGDTATKQAVATRLTVGARTSMAVSTPTNAMNSPGSFGSSHRQDDFPDALIGKRSRRPFVIGGAVVVLIVAAIVLVVIRPWQPKDGPTLTPNQMVNMLQSNGAVFNTDATAYSDFEQRIEHTSYYQDTGAVGAAILAELGCDSLPAAAVGDVIGGAPMGSLTFADWDAAVLLTTTPDRASALADLLVGCDAQIAESGGATPYPGATLHQVSATSNGVRMFGASFTEDDSLNNGVDAAVAQYGNVIIVTLSEDSWAQWQTNAASLRQAIDKAAKS